MVATPLIIGATQKAAFAALCERAAADPIDMLATVVAFTTPEGKRAHMDRMNALTIDVPAAFAVTFTIEKGHPCGTCRHMSMSSDRPGRTPTPEAVWMVCKELGFVGGLDQCTVWPEDLERGPDAIAVNVVQPVAMGVAATK